MRNFIIKIVLLMLIILAFCFGIAAFDFFVIGSQYKYGYDASLIDKVKRLQSINTPKIILVGNSNLSFGIDSKRIEDALNMPVVNLGLHGSLGNAFHEDIAKLNINEGDIVVVCHSSFSDADDISDRSVAWITIDNNPEIAKIIRPKDYPAMLAAYPNYLRNAMFLWLVNKGNTDSGDCYSRNAFNEYGDVIFKPKDNQIDPDDYFSNPTNCSKIPEINDICVSRLNEYNNYIHSRGATLVIAGYPIEYGEHATFEPEDFINFKGKLDNVLDCPVISDYTDYFYPYDYFYNGALHLTTEGAEIRTEQLISDLTEWMGYGYSPKMN